MIYFNKDYELCNVKGQLMLFDVSGKREKTVLKAEFHPEILKDIVEKFNLIKYENKKILKGKN